MEYAETMTFETTDDSMEGGANGSTAVPPANYQWSATGALSDTEPTGTIAHLLLRRDDDALYVYDISCPSFSIVGSGQAKLEPEPGSFAYDAFGPEVSGQNFPARLTCKVTIEASRRRPVTVAVGSVVTRGGPSRRPSCRGNRRALVVGGGSERPDRCRAPMHRG